MNRRARDTMTSLEAAAAIEDGEFYLDQECQRLLADQEKVKMVAELAISRDEPLRMVSEAPVEAAKALQFYAQIALRLAGITFAQNVLNKDRRS